MRAARFRLRTDENHSYGYVAPTIPELAISGVHFTRRKVIEKKTPQTLMNEAAQQRIAQINLKSYHLTPSRGHLS
ncbi:MAG: hypothetical protein M2R45_04128 [Verrucomicrobia subdivision 3 bacterium]|nr:hypothetical protein [Limisphaerales bacterium]MCS1417670.1 hypothetical protein [Limisphaerales bacterium]